MFTDPVLAQIAKEAQRLTGGRCAIREQGEGEPALVIELPGDSVVRGRWLHKHLTAFCAREGLERRHLLASGTEPRFTRGSPSVPEGWPVDPETG